MTNLDHLPGHAHADWDEPTNPVIPITVEESGRVLSAEPETQRLLGLDSIVWCICVACRKPTAGSLLCQELICASCHTAPSFAACREAQVALALNDGRRAIAALEAYARDERDVVAAMAEHHEGEGQ